MYKKIFSFIGLMMIVILTACSSKEKELAGRWFMELGPKGEGMIVEFTEGGDFKAYSVDDANDYVPELFITANYKIDGETIKIENVKKEGANEKDQSFNYKVKGDELTLDGLGTFKKMDK